MTVGEGVHEREIVFSDEHILVVYMTGTSAFTVVTFNEMGTAPSGSTFWGDAFCAKNGLEAYGVVSTTPNWYPMESMAVACAAIREHRKARALVANGDGDRLTPLVLYGHSMGGYGALKYGAALGATTALAFCPQMTIHPDEMDFVDTRYRRNFVEALHTGMVVHRSDLAARTILVFDPGFEADAAHARLFARSCVRDDESDRSLPLPYTGHEAVKLMASSQAGVAILRAAAEGDLDDCLRMMRARRRMTIAYFRNLALAYFRRSRFEPAKRILLRGFELTAPDDKACHMLSRCWESTGDLDRAVATARQGFDLDQTNVQMAEHLARLLAARAKRDLGEAADLLPGTLESTLPKGRPERIFSEVQLGRGELLAARELAEAACKKAPKDASYRRWRSDLDGRLVLATPPPPPPPPAPPPRRRVSRLRRVTRWLTKWVRSWRRPALPKGTGAEGPKTPP